MAYEKQNFTNGLTLFASQLNHIEDGIVALENLVLNFDGNTGSGGSVSYVGVEPAEDDMPKVFVTGVKPTTKDDVLAEMWYISKTEKFHAYLEIKCQGTSSMSYPKKNFTVKLYSDEARETKLKKDFKNWNHPSNKFVLKANYIDHSHARNIVSARLWSEVVASRPDYNSLPVEMRNAPNNGAVDGFPIKVYYNGNYEGVYTWNIGKDDWMWGMDEDNPNHVLLCAEGNTDGVYAETTSNFRALWNGVDGAKPGWSVEVGTNSNALKTSLNNLIQFVMDNDGDAFRNGIGNYLDIQSAIDYYIFQYEICGLDGLAHNMLLATYDGVKWRCGAYDMDATFGLWWTGKEFVAATFACPEDYQERYSLLWERIEANYSAELKARQAYLRKTVLSYSNMVAHFEQLMDVIGLDLYAEDLTIYTGIPSGSSNNIKQIRNYIRDRQAYVDAEFAAFTGEIETPDEPDTPGSSVPCTSITLSDYSLTFTQESPKTLVATVTPANTTDTVVWSVSPENIVTVADGVVTPVANGSCVITATCGGQSAICSVSVRDIAFVDYTLNPLANVEWTSGNYTLATGEYKDSTTDKRTGKFELQNCVYNFVTGDGNTYPSIFIWNENDEYVGGYNSFTSIGKFVAKAGWKYAIAVCGSGDAVSLIPVDQSANASGISTVIVDGASATWAESGNFGSEIIVTELMASAGFAASSTATEIRNKIYKCSHFMFLVSGIGQQFVATGVEPVLFINDYQGGYYLCVSDVSPADAPALVGTVTIN